MTLNQRINQLEEELGLSEELRIVLESFVDNYIGTEQQGYQNNNEYIDNNIDRIKPLFRELKSHGKFTYFQRLLKPYSNKGVDNLLSLVEG